MACANHRFLTAIDLEQENHASGYGAAVVSDSLLSINVTKTAADDIEKCLQHILHSRSDCGPPSWKFKDGDYPMQLNGSDCGVYTIVSAIQLVVNCLEEHPEGSSPQSRRHQHRLTTDPIPSKLWRCVLLALGERKPLWPLLQVAFDEIFTVKDDADHHQRHNKQSPLSIPHSDSIVRPADCISRRQSQFDQVKTDVQAILDAGKRDEEDFGRRAQASEALLFDVRRVCHDAGPDDQDVFGLHLQ